MCDYTFFHENYLTEREFREATAEKDVRDIINLFDAIGKLCLSVGARTCNVNQPRTVATAGNISDELRAVINVLNVDFAECIPWRQGSLLYAFCASKINTDTGWLDENQALFLNYLHEAINYLQIMLSIRKPTHSNASQTNETLSALVEQWKSALDEQQVEEAHRSLLQRRVMLGEQGKELEQLGTKRNA